ASPVEYNFSLQALNDGCRVVFPLPDFSAGNENFATLMIEFFNTFQTYICNCFNDEQRLQFIKLRNSLAALRLLNKASDISVLVLQFASELFERTLTLIVDKSDLIAERSAGIIANKDNGIAAPMKFRIPILSNSILREVIDSKKLFFGTREDSNITELLYPEIGSPTDGTFLLLPLISNDKVITITYADFGDFKATKIPTDYLEFFTNQAGVVMENALLRKLHNSSKQPKEIS
ncbi:MAG: hypothetical protein KAU22_07840, partial [Desulfuromonadales bacterium]|nr:hypothetical protein [Desulfuromonadales bacterium]